jgi:histidinol-phosphate aminotransferase
MLRNTRFAELAAPGVVGLQPYVPGKPTDELQRELGVFDSIKLASNENPSGPPDGAIQAMRAALTDVALYPDGAGHYLKQDLAARLSVDPAQITLGNGSNDVLVMLAETFLTPTTEAIYDQFSFVVYRLAVQAAGAVAKVAASYRLDHDQPLGHDLGAFGDLMDQRTRLVYIANPNNPTGSWIRSAELRNFLERVSADVVVVVDEAYGEYVSEPDYPDTLSWLATYPNLVVTRTFSKIYGLAGLRIGYAVSHPSVAELLNRVRQPFNVSSLGQVAARAALKDHAFVTRSREINQKGLQQLTAGLQALGISTLPSIGNFVLANMGGPARQHYEALLRVGVIVRPVENYGLTDYLRITVGLPEQNQRLIDNLREIVVGRDLKR